MRDENQKPESEDSRFAIILEAWYEALESGQVPSVQEICGHDEAMMARLRSVTSSEQDLVDELQGRSPETSTGKLPAKTLGDYRLIRPIGSGGSGQVYLAEQIDLSRTVALKVLDKRTMGNAQAILRFRREAEITAALDHPNIVPVYGIGEDKGFFFIAMKWLTGPSLDSDGLDLSPQAIARIGREVADCLHEAHACGVVHRDIKPGNIVMDTDRAFVVDFGLARASNDLALTQEGIIAGTLPYLAPEQIELRTAGHDPRTDIYALGVTLYTLCNGAPPFIDTDQRRLARKIVISDPAPLPLLRGDRDLETIILRALEKEPNDRYQTAKQMAEELDKFQRGEIISTHAVGRVRKTWRFVQRRKSLSATLSVMLVVIISLTVLRINRWQEEKILIGAELAQMEEALRAGQLERADVLHANFDGRYPENEEGKKFNFRLKGEQALTSFFDMLIDSASSKGSLFGQILADCKKYDADEIQPELFKQATLLARFLQGHFEEARTGLQKLKNDPLAQDSRLLKIMDSLFNDHPLTWPIQEAAHSADEYVFCAIVLHLQNIKTEKVIAELNKAKIFEVGHRRLHLVYGVALSKQRKYAEAAYAFSSLLSGGRGSSVLHRNHAQVLMLMNRLDEAEAALARITDANPDSYFYIVNSQIEARRGHPEKALAWLEEGRRMWPKNGVICRVLMGRLINAGQIEAAKKLRENFPPALMGSVNWQSDQIMFLTLDFVEIVPEDPWARMQTTSEKKTKLGHLAKKIEALRPKIKHDFSLAQMFWLRAWICVQQGDLPQAMEHLSSAIDAAPKLTKSYIHFIHFIHYNLADNDYLVLGDTESKSALQEASDYIGDLLEDKGLWQKPPSKFVLGELAFKRVKIAKRLGDLPLFLRTLYEAKERDTGIDSSRMRYFDKAIDWAKKKL